MTHMRSYPKNPKLEPGTGMPTDDKQFVKMLFNAKAQAEEEYRNQRPYDWSPVIYESQILTMKNMVGIKMWEPIDAWLRESWEVIDDTPRIEEMSNSWSRMNEILDRMRQDRMNMTYIAPQGRGKTWLGSQIARSMEEDLEVPGLRDRAGFRTNQAWIDETHDWAADSRGPSLGAESKESNPALSEWLQRRSVCFRASSCSIS